MSHDNRFPKTNYLKTNLLKQIKKNIFVILSDDTFFYLRCKGTKKDYSNQIILLFFASLQLKKQKNRGNSLRITPI